MVSPVSDSYRNTRLVVDELEQVDHWKMNLQLIANEENQDRAQCGKNEAGLAALERALTAALKEA